MGREIRRVPLDWEHPTDISGRHIPIFDTYIGDVNAEEWEAETEAPFSETDRACYRQRKWETDEATAFQIYENVSEGTPVSPIFQDEREMRSWLMSRGYSEKAVAKFVELGFAFSMAVTFGSEGTEIKMGIDALD